MTDGGRPGGTTRLVAVGDLQLGDSPTTVGFGFRSRYPGHSQMSRWVTRVSEILGEADVVFGNLEGVISEAGLVRNDWRSVQLRGRPEYAQFVRKAGFTVLNVANNHAYQHGERAFKETLDCLEAEGIGAAGVRGESPWHSRPVLLATPGGKVGVLAYCLRPRQYSGDLPPYAESDPAGVREDVLRLRQEVDHVLVSLHWGEEFVGTPSETEAAWAASILDAGVDVLIGHHPHVLRPCQKMGGRAVAYSLGNFTGDMIWHEPLRVGGVLRCSLGQGVSDVRIDTVEVGDDYLPTLTGRSLAPAEQLSALPEAKYQEEIERTMRSQRRDLYKYALRNLYRFPPRILSQLLRTTVSNKLRGLSRPDRSLV